MKTIYTDSLTVLIYITLHDKLKCCVRVSTVSDLFFFFLVSDFLFIIYITGQYIRKH